MNPNQLIEGRSRETEIRRDAGGRWWNGEDQVDHPQLVRSFDSWIDRAADGRFCLKNDVNWAYIALEGPPYFVRSLMFSGQVVTLLLSGGTSERLDPATLRQTADGALWCDVRSGRVPACFDNHAAHQLAEVIAEDADGVYLTLEGGRARPPVVDDPLLSLRSDLC